MAPLLARLNSIDSSWAIVIAEFSRLYLMLDQALDIEESLDRSIKAVQGV